MASEYLDLNSEHVKGHLDFLNKRVDTGVLDLFEIVCHRPNLFSETVNLRELLALFLGIIIGHSPPHGGGTAGFCWYVCARFQRKTVTDWASVFCEEFSGMEFVDAAEAIRALVHEWRASIGLPANADYPAFTGFKRDKKEGETESLRQIDAPWPDLKVGDCRKERNENGQDAKSCMPFALHSQETSMDPERLDVIKKHADPGLFHLIEMFCHYNDMFGKPPNLRELLALLRGICVGHSPPRGDMCMMGFDDFVCERFKSEPVASWTLVLSRELAGMKLVDAAAAIRALIHEWRAVIGMPADPNSPGFTGFELVPNWAGWQRD